MTTEAPRVDDPAFAEAYGRAWSSSDPGNLLRFFVPDGHYEDTGMGTSWSGHDGIAAFVGHMLDFAPDSRIDFRDVCTDGRRWSARWDWFGTAAGPLLLDGQLIPPTNRAFTVSGVCIGDVAEEGRLVTHVDVYDTRAMLRACGMDAQSRADRARTTVEQLYEALQTGDGPRVEALLAKDVTVEITEGMPAGAGSHVGPTAARRDGWWDIGRAFSAVPEPDEWVATTDGRVLVRGRYRGARRSDGARVDAPFTHLVAVDGDGRITQLSQVTDTRRWGATRA